jgi:Bacterial pre-peptidase C-terminal domain
MTDDRWSMNEGHSVRARERILFDHRSSIIACLTILLAFASIASAKAPTLEHLFPAGGSRGSIVEVTATGQFERWPVGAWCSDPSVAIKAGSEKGKLSVTIAPGASPGVHWVRLFDDEGPTAARPFFVGILPEVNETEPNDEPSNAQRVEASGVTVNGRLARNGDVDGFRFALKKGQTLVAMMEANRRLASPMDGVLQVASSDGFVLAQNDDDLDRDPRIAFEAPRDGDYLVRAFAFPFVQESSIRFAGGSNFIYRLTLTAGGIVDHAYPLAVSTEGRSEVEAVGWNVPKTFRKISVEPSDDDETISISNPMLANPVEVKVVDEPSIAESEPNDRAHPQKIALPVAISGRIDRPGDVDTFAFEARKDDRLVFRVDSRSLGLPLDPVLRIADASGATIVEVDDARKGFDPEIKFTAPADASYRVTVRDLNGQGGPRHAYLLTAGRPRADFALTLKTDQFAIAPGKPLDVVVAVERREGYAEPIEIRLLDHFDGVIASSATSLRSGPSASSATLKLVACDCARPGPIQVVGISGDGRRKRATATAAGFSTSIDSAWLTPLRPASPKKPEAKEATQAK